MKRLLFIIFVLLISTQALASSVIQETVKTGQTNSFTADQNFVNLTASGTVTQNGFELPIGATDGYVLTTDADGTGTWQAAAGGVSDLAAGSAIGCGVSISGTTLTVNYKDGTALSASQKCQIGATSGTDGQATTVELTANTDLTFGASSDTDGNFFGAHNMNDNWSSSMNLYLGVVSDGTFEALTLNRVPVTSTGTVDQVCFKDDTDCDGVYDTMIIKANTENAGDWVQMPIENAGWIQATLTTAGVWTFTIPNQAGFNKLADKQKLTVPTGVNNAVTGTYIRLNGGTTAMTFTTNQNEYSIGYDGYCSIEYYMDGNTATDGSGGVSVQVMLPLPSAYDREQHPKVGRIEINSGVPSRLAAYDIPANEDYFEIASINQNGAAALEWLTASKRQLDNFSDADRAIEAAFKWRCYE